MSMFGWHVVRCGFKDIETMCVWKKIDYETSSYGHDLDY